MSPFTYQPYRWMLALLLFVTAVDAAITVANPVLLGLVIDKGIYPHRIEILIALSVLMAALGLIDTVANYLQAWPSARIGQGVILNLRTQVFKKRAAAAAGIFHALADRLPCQPAQHRRDRGTAGDYQPAGNDAVNRF